jgi:hypothetical protein
MTPLALSKALVDGRDSPLVFDAGIDHDGLRLEPHPTIAGHSRASRSCESRT